MPFHCCLHVMPLKRFKQIRANLHFNDDQLMKSRDDPQHYRTFEIQPVLEHFNHSFLDGMYATKQQSVDERIIKCKGPNILKQFAKGKPVQWGLKLWCRCDSTGCLFEFDLYTGKKTDYVGHGLGEAVVLFLTDAVKSLGCQV